MKNIPFTNRTIITQDEAKRVSEALEIAVEALSASSKESTMLLGIIRDQSEGLQALMVLQDAMVNTLNVAAQEGLSLDEFRDRLFNVVSEFAA